MAKKISLLLMHILEMGNLISTLVGVKFIYGIEFFHQDKPELCK